MRTTFISLGIALLIAVLVRASIIFLDPGMNLDKAFGNIFYAFVGSGILTALVLTLRGRRLVANDEQQRKPRTARRRRIPSARPE